jgi:sigma-B regulation protein RsbU (phosphoserine phosphatase)
MPRASPGTSSQLTLVAEGEIEAAQASFWRPIDRRWPTFAPPPSLQILEWERATDPSVAITGGVVVIVAPSDPRRLFALLDRLAESMTPAVLLHDPSWTPPDADEHLVTMPTDTDPAVAAAIIATLSERQQAVESLRAEIGVSRRFHGGLRCEIEKIHEELQLAASVQREFLPRAIPAIDGFDLQVFFRPCGYVSGDIYDVQRLDDRHVGLFVADAVGHGVPAALMTMVLCRCLPTVDHEGGVVRLVPPSEALQRLNQDLTRRHGEGSRFATAVYTVIDTQTRRVSVAGAGHPYPLRVRGTRVERVETEGGLMGIDTADAFPEVSFTLGEDELLVLYTDGFETAFPAPNVDAYGRRLPNRNYIDRFVTLSKSWRERGLPAAFAELIEQIDLQDGSLHQADDLTAMVMAPTARDPLANLMAGLESRGAPREPDPSVKPIRAID